ncbi:hypothetical protein NM208_g14766 [Fusarium decemcellulare]|uniref:Uncharacterized protein n=1 Tax=Fusarium decemcellulare TaxID=57161 RepID=A0ACC1RHL1_9HYPO|nr:hypothetical protein NM208_g14766 [Fusarium decemcellulare]
MLPMSSRYEEAMAKAGVAVQATQGENIGCCMFSSVRGREVNPLAFDQDCDPCYWKDNMTSTVQFTAAVKSMFRAMPGLEAVVEIGPHPALKGPFEDTIAELGADAGAALPYFSSCFRGTPDLSAMLESAGRMVAAGLQSLALDRVNAVELDDQTQRQGIVLSDLPAYAWDHSASYWAETRVSRNYRLRDYPTHELLGARKHTDHPLAMSWRSLITLKSVPWLAKWKEQEHASIIPWSAYILMVSEAALQLATNSCQLVEIDQMQFHQDYPLSNLDSDDCVAEFSFDAFPHATGSKLDFHISAEDASSEDKSWIRLCSGTLNLAPDEEEAKKNTMACSGPEPRHDSRICEYAETFPLPDLARILDVRIDYEGAKGDIACGEDDSSLAEHIVSPLALHSVLRVPTLAFLKHSEPTDYRLKSIERVTLSPRAATNHNSGIRQFNTSYTRPVNGQASATTQLIGDDETGVLMELQNATYEAGEPLNRNPPLKSLFFAPKIVPDISYLNDTDVPISLDNLLNMVAHKWPMADIAIAGLPPTDACAIVSLLPGLQADKRPRFRSATILASEDEHDLLDSSRIRFVDDLASKHMFHAVFASPDHVVEAAKAIHPDGVLCITSTTPFESEDETNELHILGSVSTSSPQNWTLTRLGPLPNLNGTVRVSAGESDPPQHKLKIIVPPGVHIPAFGFDAINSASVEIVYLANPSATSSLAEETFDAIVLDLGPESSILTASTGSELLPWVQTMLKNVGLLIWASVQLPNRPHTAVDGAFIRTLRTEDPTLVAASVVFESPSHDQDGVYTEQRAIYGVLADVHAAMRHGNVETELFVRNGRVHALRYVPDDELAAWIGAGVAAPLSKQRSLGDHEYRLSHQGRGRVQALVHPTPVANLGESQTYHVEVVVEASLIDLEDVSRLVSSTSPYANSDLGGFFVGRVRDAQDTRVFGWAPTAHQRRVYLSREAVIPLGVEVNVADALYNSAHHIIALLALDEMARVRAGDKICTHGVPQPLDTALEHVAAMRKASMVQTRGINDVDVVISYDSSLGLVVNGRTMSLHRLLSRKSLASFVSEDTLSAQARYEVKTFPVSSYKEAFSYSTKHSAPAVLLHPPVRNEGATCSSVAAPKEPGVVQTLFRSDGAYVVLGGLGGLGRGDSDSSVR